MKTLKTILTLFLTAICVGAGTLNDGANIFGPDSGKVADALRDKPVWIETAVKTPIAGLKSYADEKVGILTNRGFLVVITTQPRAWRISMAPAGLASSEATRMAGDAMTEKFKHGKFSEGGIELAQKLTDLSNPEKAKAGSGAFLFWGVIFVVVFVLLVVIFFLLISRRDRLIKERERAARESAERESVKFTPESLTASQKRKAEKLFNKYTPAERQQMAVQYSGSPGYNASMTDSPFFWWWLMSTNNHACCQDYSQAHSSPQYDRPSYAEPSRSRSDDSSSYSSGYSSSDSIGSSWSSDSGGSSFDSGSCSDSSGASGSW